MALPGVVVPAEAVKQEPVAMRVVGRYGRNDGRRGRGSLDGLRIFLGVALVAIAGVVTARALGGRREPTPGQIRQVDGRNAGQSAPTRRSRPRRGPTSVFGRAVNTRKAPEPDHAQ